MIKVGIIGVGPWGTNYLRTFDELGIEVKWICSRTETTINKALENVKPKIPIKTTTNYKDILEDKEVDAVAIATPADMLCNLAKESLEYNKHVLVEKPVAFHSKDVEELIRISKERKKIFMVGHIHRYNPGIRRIKKDIDGSLFGRIQYISLFHFGNSPRKDMGAMWDYSPHFVSILLYLLGEMPLSVNASSASYIGDNGDIANINLKFSNNVFAISIASWLYPIKKMELTIIGKKLSAIFNDHAKEEKLKYYEDGNCTIVEIENKMSLTEEIKHFLQCIENNKNPFTDGEEALKVTRVLEAAQQSLDNGEIIKIS